MTTTTDHATTGTGLLRTPDGRVELRKFATTGPYRLPADMPVETLAEWERDLLQVRAPRVDERELERRRRAQRSAPWYPLDGHRRGLKANDPVSLGSALAIVAWH